MNSSLRLWWQKIRQHPVAIWMVIAGVVGIALIVVLALGYWLDWDWTGLGPYMPPTKDNNFQRGKTLWDWLQLLIIPVVLAVAGFWLNQIQKSREEEATDKRTIAEQEAAEKRAQTEREIASDYQREAALQAYIDKMSELLLEKRLRGSAEDDEVRKIARVRTLRVLPRLDKERKRSVLQFLHESGLIEKGKRIIDLSGADLSGANLSGADLGSARGADLGSADLSAASAANLSGANLYRANLRTASGADLSAADLSGANLYRADLSEASMSEVNLYKANLGGANLYKADLRTANLRAAYLFGANLRAANLGEANLHWADMGGADVNAANLYRADLRGANLHAANLREAYLFGADLSAANLSVANLGAARISTEQLDTAKSLEGAIMPDGSTHPY